MQNKRWLLCLLITLGFLASPLHAEKVAQLPKPTGYVDDYANVLSPNAKADMEAICVELHNKTKAQIFVVTVNTLDGEAIEPYANDLFHTWKIGEKKTDRGALILLAAHDHKYRIEVGYGLEGILNDAKVGDIGRTMVPYLRANDYDSALRSSLSSVAKVVADDSNVTLDTLISASETTPAPAPTPTDSSSNHSWIFITLFAVVWVGIFGLVIVLRIFGRKGGRTGSGGAGFFTSGGSDSGSSSDGGGDSFGGGDGGDSGGGGASGSW